jgi:HAE1 family hydrophobic/amphiphilic exporter-1
MAIIVISHIELGILYESFIHPLTILSGLPASGFGVLIHPHTVPLGAEHLCLCRNYYANRDSKNAIMMVDFALESQRNEGISPIYED